MPKQSVRICPSDRFCRIHNLPTNSVELIWPITELCFRQILSTDFMNRFYLDVKTGPYRKTNYRAKSGVPAISGYPGVNFRNNDKIPITAKK